MPDLKERLGALVPDAVRETPRLWVVGGAVRDVLLGLQPRELDLLVEGDARVVAEQLGTVDAEHERFGTFTVAGVDVASARRESYAAPGALPDVELGATVVEDLARRDFTVNAIAWRVADGHVEAWPGALEDLEARVLRVLHERSFVDDPTRVLRMARYAARLEFSVVPETARLAAAVRWDSVTGARVGAEVRLALKEPLPAVLMALPGAAVHPAYVADEALLARVLAEVPPGAEPGLAALGACLLDADGVAEALDRLAFGAGERAIVVAASEGWVLKEGLLAARSPSAVASVAARQPAEALAVAAALGAQEPVARWFGEWGQVRTSVTGDDLLAAGLSGPAVGAGLRAALAAALDQGADHEAQLAAALEAAR